MKKIILKSALLVLAGTGLVAGNAFATPVNVSGINGEDTLSTIFANQSWTIDPNADQITSDQYWQVTETATGSWASLLIEIAGNAGTNTFGIFDGVNQLTLLSGSAESGDKISISFGADGLLSAVYWDYTGDTLNGISLIAQNVNMSQTFGFFIGNANGPLFYSDETMNSDLSDHMVSYAGTGANGLSVNHYAIAFEDTAAPGWDYDYNDMVLMLESVQPVPEPATMLLFGAGLIGLAGVASRRKVKK